MTNPKTYLITLLGHRPSEEIAKSALDSAQQYNWDVELFPAVNGWEMPSNIWEEYGLKWHAGRIADQTRPGVQGCFLSHFTLWNLCVELDQPIVILEQDAIIQGPWDPAAVCGEVYKLHTAYGNEYYPLTGNASYSSHAYYLTPAGAAKLINFAKQHGGLAVDIFIGDQVVDLGHATSTLVERANKFSTTDIEGELLINDVSDRRMRLVFCLPGHSFSKSFLTSWTQTIQWCHDNDIDYSVSIVYIPIIYHARNQILGGSRISPKNLKPFNGKIEYDWLVWIDSDQVWEPEDIAQLLTNPDHKVVTGMVLFNDNEHFAVSAYDADTFDRRRWLTRDDINVEAGRFITPECGMGFMVVQYGVFEQLEYPWFFPTAHDEGDRLWFESEDGSFCNRIKKLGIDIWVDPAVQIGHEKARILHKDSPHGFPV
jgi:GR25 family glycosyltransferase involved in LPS biosynthesis